MAGQKSEARGFLEESFIVSCHKTTRRIPLSEEERGQSTTIRMNTRINAKETNKKSVRFSYNQEQEKRRQRKGEHFPKCSPF